MHESLLNRFWTRNEPVLKLCLKLCFNYSWTMQEIFLNHVWTMLEPFSFWIRIKFAWLGSEIIILTRSRIRPLKKLKTKSKTFVHAAFLLEVLFFLRNNLSSLRRIRPVRFILILIPATRVVWIRVQQLCGSESALLYIWNTNPHPHN